MTETAWLLIVIGRVYLAAVPMLDAAACNDALALFQHQVPATAARAVCLVQPVRPDPARKPIDTI